MSNREILNNRKMFLLSFCIIFLSPVTILSVASLKLPNIEKFKESILEIVDTKSKKVGRILKLECIVSGTPEPEIEFYYNGKKLTNSSSRVKYISDSIVQIHNVSYLTDEGIYKCMAKNINGNVFEEKFILIPTSGNFKPGQGEEAEVEWHEVNLGRPYEVVCPEHTYIYPIKYFWITKPKVGSSQFIDQGHPNVHVTQNGRLFIASVTKELLDEIVAKGGLRCMVQMGQPDFPQYIYSRPIGLHYKDNETVVRDVKPIIVHDFPGTTYAENGGSVTLQCLASGSPLPTMNWFRNGVAIYGNESDYVINKEGTLLTIKNIDKSKVGQYMCSARNTLGTSNLSGNIILGERASLTEKLLATVHVPEGNKLRLKCSSSGTLPVHYYWYKDGNLLSDYCFNGSCLQIKDGVLEITFASKLDKGQYQCTAKNDFGSDNSITRVIITKPEPPTTGITGKNMSNKDSKTEDNGKKDSEPKPDANGRANATRSTEGENSLTMQNILIIACGGTVFIILIVGAIVLCCRRRNGNKDVRFIPTPRRELHKPIHTEADYLSQTDLPPPPKLLTDSDDDLSSFGGAKMNHPEFIRLMSDVRYKHNGSHGTGSTTPEHLYYDIPENLHSSHTVPMTDL